MRACVWQSSVYSEEKSQTDSLAARERGETSFSLLVVGFFFPFYSIALQSQRIFAYFWLKFCTFELGSSWKELDASCFCVLIGEASR